MIYLWIWHGDAVRVNWRNYNWIFLISQDCMSVISMYKPTQGTLDKEATFKSILPILYDLCLRASSLLTPSFRQVVYKRQKSVAVYRSDFPSIQIKKQNWTLNQSYDCSWWPIGRFQIDTVHTTYYRHAWLLNTGQCFRNDRYMDMS